MEEPFSLDKFSDDEIRRILTSLMPIAAQSSVAILAHTDNGQPWQHGTGTLVRIGDSRFLISAAHVATDARKLSAVLRLIIPREAVSAENVEPLVEVKMPADNIPLEGKAAVTVGGEDDPFDLAIWSLSERTVASLGSKTFLNRTDITESADDGGAYFVYGFPTELTRPEGERTIVSRPVAFLAQSANANGRSLRNYNQQCHLLMGTRVAALSGVVVKSLKGVSGASVWKLNCRPGGLDSWSREKARIAAVETCVFDGAAVIRGTRWIMVFAAIMKAFPELVPGLTQLALRR